MEFTQTKNGFHVRHDTHLLVTVHDQTSEARSRVIAFAQLDLSGMNHLSCYNLELPLWSSQIESTTRSRSFKGDHSRPIIYISLTPVLDATENALRHTKTRLSFVQVCI